jgi:hypothetical protein
MHGYNPLSDGRSYFWSISKGRQVVKFADTEQELKDEEGQYYESFIIDKGVVEKEKYTLVIANSQCFEGDRACIFDNAKRR